MNSSSSVSESEYRGPLTPASSINTGEPIPADPNTVEGQRIGATLAIKRRPAPGCDAVDSQVGDLVKVLVHCKDWCQVDNLRLKITEIVPWAIMFPMSTGSVCDCKAGMCRCVKENGNIFNGHSTALEAARTYDASNVSEMTLSLVQAADPATFEGQQPGAILIIKQKPCATSHFKICPIEVGDYIEIVRGIPKDAGRIKAKNMRTGAEGDIIWNAVFPVSIREVCDCFGKWNRKCRYVYINFDKSVANVKFYPNSV